MDTPMSPCVANCCLTASNICIGCHRSLFEITEWSQASSVRKEEIINKAKQRAEGMLKPC